MTKASNLLGLKFGKLTVEQKLPSNKHGKTMWLCRCDCGKEVIVMGTDLKRGHTSSCGCYQKEILVNRLTVHGKAKTRLHRIWEAIKTRCYNKNTKNYKNYGGRGITMCDEWLNDFMSFYDWAMNNGYSNELSIDRINNNEGYYPSNCRWATSFVQTRNTRKNHLLTYDKKTMCIAEWENILGYKHGTIKGRLSLGWTIEEIIETPIGAKRIIKDDIPNKEIINEGV